MTAPGSPSGAPAVVSYNDIEANIANVAINGAELRVTWRDPRTGAVVGESTAWMAADQSLGSRMGATMKRSIVQEIAYSIMSTISGMLGGTTGRIVQNVAYTASNDLQNRALSNVDYTEDSRRAGVVQAFASVRDKFTWDETARRFTVG